MAENLFNDAETLELMRKIIGRFTADDSLKADLLQECILRVWSLEREGIKRTRSWYLQNCRFHVQHYLQAGRSIDSLKRQTTEKRLLVDENVEELGRLGFHTNGDLFETVCLNDLIRLISSRLDGLEASVFKRLTEGVRVREIAKELHLSYPTVIKLRRRVASVAIKLGVARLGATRCYRIAAGNFIQVSFNEGDIANDKIQTAI